MAIRYLKKGKDMSEKMALELEVKKSVEEIISNVEKNGDQALLDYTEKFEKWKPKAFQLDADQIQKAIDQLSDQELSDIEFAQKQIRDFAIKQKQSLKDIEVETEPGVFLGHKNLPVESVACYVPGGKYPMIASAHMSVITAKVAGVKRILATSPANQGKTNSAVIAAMHMGGADEIYVLGGAHAQAAFAHGTETISPVDMLVGPGNAYVAEAKRQLFGKVGIDLFAGPTETLVVAEDNVDENMCAIDLLGQAEHGTNSPAILLTNSEQLAKKTMDKIGELLKKMPTGEVASISWENYGEVILCDTYEEMLAKANEIASEHVQIMTKDDQYFLDNMSNYGALFLGARTNVAYGDKVIGTNHTLPTKKAARYTGGLWVGKFIKTCTYQRIENDASSERIGEYCSRLCMMEGFAGHAEQANERIRKFGKKQVEPYTAYGVKGG